ncbi:flagellar biosynthesis protein FlhF [Cellvibrio japonicus]|uniref:Flagellar biosynthesis protein FlhF n=1 Tax=Cellvibrio japonicus (strain Ueda107) TaxID=498211 RepID=B3PIK3_CELJU|nr:flagellar biosynthesis protein FlhF [Cellvibrio japonicus]ACE83278.1 flagellar biosynthesis protein FlhF [Cellvibrio japonicus Ueda107]QEI12598.1 flagellar biosynthesis protein FlhF [Cellvibrio japonicus]QEI16172.1 flagellar biosynthesis protein FlhF [Cellvibrio japonicus]QEI19750.1 flagellar biosynthesis protein FlhF [Cellvibrio japonicus]
MQVKRFVAADMRRALELVRQELGPEAIILSSNRIPEGVELLTTLGSDSELAQLQRQTSGRAALVHSQPLLSDAAVGQSLVAERTAVPPKGAVLMPAQDHPNAGKTGSQLVEEIERAHQRMLAARKAEESAKEFLLSKQAEARQKQVEPAAITRVNAAIPRHESSERRRTRVESDLAAAANLSRTRSAEKKVLTAAEKYPLVDEESPLVIAPAASSMQPAAVEPVAKANPDANTQLAELQAEIADMRFLLEQQLDRLTGETAQAADSPVLASISRRLERMGLAKDAITQVIARCNKHKSLAEAWPDALANLAHQLPIHGRDIVDQGGIFAFVGPTGVGKTTTIGKLAARYVLQHGADKVALITTDTYRIAAHDQLRSLARILRVPVKVVDEANSLDMVLRSLRHCSLVLIDTAGFRHGDPHLKAQLHALAELKQVNTYLVMSCNSQAQMLKASIHAYGAARLQGCILTKLDETASMGEALGVVMQSRLPVAYTTDGQDIPKNIEVARAHQLVSRAAALLKANPASAVL